MNDAKKTELELMEAYKNLEITCTEEEEEIEKVDDRIEQLQVELDDAAQQKQVCEEENRETISQMEALEREWMKSHACDCVLKFGYENAAKRCRNYGDCEYAAPLGTLKSSTDNGRRTDQSNYFHYLSALRDSGKVNMFGAAEFLADEFSISKTDARKVLTAWMTDPTLHSNRTGPPVGRVARYFQGLPVVEEDTDMLDFS